MKISKLGGLDAPSTRSAKRGGGSMKRNGVLTKKNLPLGNGNFCGEAALTTISMTEPMLFASLLKTMSPVLCGIVPNYANWLFQTVRWVVKLTHAETGASCSKPDALQTGRGQP